MRTMRAGLGLAMAIGFGVPAMGPAAMAVAQTPAAARAQVLLSSGGLVSDRGRSENEENEEIVREIDDPHTGDRWLLERNGRYPGGPGRLVRIAADCSACGGASGRVAKKASEGRPIPVIRAGDRLIVTEHTAVVDAVLEARALNPAMAGSALNVRLTIGGNVVRAVALAPGRAALQPETGARP